MAKRYRLTPIETSNDAGDTNKPHHQTSQGKSSGRGWLWTFIGLAAVILIALAGVWMSHVSGSLSHLNHTAQHNAQSLAHQSAQLSGIRAQLHLVSQQLSQLSQQMTTFFGNLMQSIRSSKL